MREATVTVTIHWIEALKALRKIVERDLETHIDRFSMHDVRELESMADEIRRALGIHRRSTVYGESKS